MHGGFGAAVAQAVGGPVLCLGWPDDGWVGQGTEAELRADCGLDGEALVRRIGAWLKELPAHG